MFAGLLFRLILIMKLCPETPTGRLLHRGLVEAPLEKLATMDRRHIIFAVVALGMLLSFTELIMILGSTDLVMLMAWDVSLYVDAVIATWTIAAVARGKAAWQLGKTRIAGLWRVSPRPRTSRRKSVESKPPANDPDEDGVGWAYALAA
jgi:hypothetical protein